MSTGYFIEAGYISGYTTHLRNEHIVRELERTVEASKSPEFWHDELGRLPGHIRDMQDEGGLVLDAYCAQYGATDGCPVSFDGGRIFIGCSGSGQSRKMKEIVAMMFCRIVLYRMNIHLGVPLTITVS